MIKVISWNLLSQSYAPLYEKRLLLQDNQDIEIDHITSIFNFDRRILKFKQEIKELQADIICFQELDFLEDIEDILKDSGYKYKFMKRPNKKLDGLLIAWNYEKYQYINEVRVNYNDLGMKSDFITQKHNIGYIIRLLVIESNKILTISNTHLYFAPHREELRLMQTELLLTKLKDDENVIFCGDFNSLPGSKVYNLICKQEIKLLGKSAGFVCDETLGKLAKNLRALGISCVQLNGIVKAGNEAVEKLHHLIETENRIFLTTSRQFYQRRVCPVRSVLIKASSVNDNFEQLVEHTGLKLDPSKFYLRCVKCDGDIKLIKRDSIPQDRIGGNGCVSGKNHVPLKVIERVEDDISMCVGCEQLFWWDDEYNYTSTSSKKSSSARIKALVEKLSIIQKRALDKRKFKSRLTYRDRVVSVQDRIYSSPILLIDTDVARSDIDTNITSEFKGRLDYIFCSPTFKILSHSVKPEMKEPFLPSLTWPSDHCRVESIIKLKLTSNG